MLDSTPFVETGLPSASCLYESMTIPFNERGVSVTRNALSAGGQVFPLREIGSVRVLTVPKSKVVPVTISIVGALGAIVAGVFASSAGIVCGVMLIVVGWLTWISQDVTHRLLVEASGSEREALSSTDREFVERVAQTVRGVLEAAPKA